LLGLGIAMAVLVIVCAWSPVETGAQSQSGASLALDANASNGSGACSPIDTNAEFTEGDDFTVAVCLESSGDVPVAAFGFYVTYDDRVVRAPEVADNGDGLDDNPDVNTGSSTFSSSTLGGGWDCTGSVGAYPEGDDDGEPGNGVGAAYSGGCSSAAGPNTLTEGPLAVIRFNAVGGGEARLTLTKVSITGDDLLEIGSCEPPVDLQMDCEGATINVSGALVPGVTPGAVITPGTPSVGNTPGMGSTPASEGTTSPGQNGASGTPGPGTPASDGTAQAAATAGTSVAGDDDETRTPSRAATPRSGTVSGASGSGDDDDDGGGATAWIIVGAVAAAVAAAGGGAAYWFRFRTR
jgi:hypothetical protein